MPTHKKLFAEATYIRTNYNVQTGCPKGNSTFFFLFNNNNNNVFWYILLTIFKIGPCRHRYILSTVKEYVGEAFNKLR